MSSKPLVDKIKMKQTHKSGGNKLIEYERRKDREFSWINILITTNIN